MATTTSRKKRGGRNHQCEPVFAAPHLSHEIIVEILSRSPVKSLCRFRCVSKLWLSTISCPKFAKTHLDLAFQNNTQKQVLISWAGEKVCSIDWESINADDVVSKGVVAVELDGSLKDYPDWFTFRDNTMCSSNGLICIVDSDEKTFLVINPCTGEPREIPLGSQKYDTWCDMVYGFGYTSKSDDYKLVRINGENIGMYSLRSGTWSKCTAPQMLYEIFWTAPGVPLNGALHWLGSRILSEEVEEEKCVVVCFDLNENTIWEMPAPEHDYDIVHDLTLGVVNGCLCAHYDTKNVEAFWVMREYNNGESWTKISSISVPLNTLGLAKKRVNVQTVGREIVLCNFENGTHGIPVGDNFDIGTYVESLISPNHYVGN